MIILASRRLFDERNRVIGMLPDFGRPIGSVHLLTYEEVIDAHFCIADFFAEKDYGIGGIGPRDIGLLVSTVERQFTGFEGYVVYKSHYEQIASLMYGIIKNHPFHDANKRTAFLCALLQLHKMGRTITIPQKEFEDLMIAIADDSISRRSELRRNVKKGKAHPEIRYLGRYLEKSSRRNARLQKAIKFRDLRSIINKYGFDFQNAYKGTIDIVKTEKRRVHRFWRKDRVEEVKTTVGNIAYHGEGIDVPDSTIKLVRQLCGLTDQDGFDSDVLLRSC